MRSIRPAARASAWRSRRSIASSSPRTGLQHLALAAQALVTGAGVVGIRGTEGGALLAKRLDLGLEQLLQRADRVAVTGQDAEHRREIVEVDGTARQPRLDIAGLHVIDAERFLVVGLNNGLCRGRGDETGADGRRGSGNNERQEAEERRQDGRRPRASARAQGPGRRRPAHAPQASTKALGSVGGAASIQSGTGRFLERRKAGL